MKVFKKIIKKLARKLLNDKEILELLRKSILFQSEKIDWEETKDLFTKIFNENPKFRDYILLRKSSLLNGLFDDDKNYIQGAIDELTIMENLYSKKDDFILTKKEENNLSVEKFLNYFKGRNNN